MATPGSINLSHTVNCPEETRRQESQFLGRKTRTARVVPGRVCKPLRAAVTKHQRPRGLRKVGTYFSPFCRLVN